MFNRALQVDLNSPHPRDANFCAIALVILNNSISSIVILKVVLLLEVFYNSFSYL
jgi:hypothetical protein